jgi:hypothetical protein
MPPSTRAQRRSQGKDSPRTPRIRHTDVAGHISNDWFRRQVWYPAVKATGSETAYGFTTYGTHTPPGYWQVGLIFRWLKSD